MRRAKRPLPPQWGPRRLLRRDFPGQELILDILQEGEELRERQRLLDMRLQYLLEVGIDADSTDGKEEIEPLDVIALRKGWNAFLHEGGVCADDLHSFLRGEPIGPAARVKRHLRLISNNLQPLRRLRALIGHDAA
jgi:hypothetical protein